MDYNLEGKVFRSVSNTGNGEVGAGTRFHYRQAGDIVTADYSGGGILVGHLIARALAGGQLDMRYHGMRQLVQDRGHDRADREPDDWPDDPGRHVS